MNSSSRKLRNLTLFLVGLYLALRFLLPLVSPFLLGGLLALAAEPLVRFLTGTCRLPRGGAAVLGVTAAFALLTLAALLVLGFLFRQLRQLSGIAPSLAEGIRSGMDSLSGRLLILADRAPQSLRPVLTGQVRRFFSDGSSLLDRAVSGLLSLASGILSRVPGGALSLGTGILSSYMISAKLPAVSGFLRRKVPTEKIAPLLSATKQLKTVIVSWLKAQLKLSGVTFLTATAGFFLLRISSAPLWGLLVAAVDAFPILGTGTVLIPWSLVSFLQSNHFQAFALLGLYSVTVVLRSVLEPRLVGRHLGLDPLVTLIALYIGFRLFGLPGMLLSPVLAVAVFRLSGSIRTAQPDRSDPDSPDPT